MAGKTTYLRQVALIVLLAQIGCFVPAQRARIGWWTASSRASARRTTSPAANRTFMVEMLETAAILHHATTRSLVVLDEIGRGTSTYDGLAIAARRRRARAQHAAAGAARRCSPPTTTS